jgi:hypothetical protein
MELKLDFLKNFLDSNALELSVKTSRKSFKSYVRPSFSSRNPRTSRITLNSRLYTQNNKSLPIQSEHKKPPNSLKKLLVQPINSKKNLLKPTSSSLCVKFAKTLAVFDKKQELTPPRSKITDYTLTQAQNKVKEHNNKIWLGKHNSKNHDENHLIKFASEFFKEIDKNNTGYIDGETFLKSLLHLGIATDANVLKETLSMIFECHELSKLHVSNQKFVSMFRFDVITDLILNQLNESASTARKNQRLTRRTTKVIPVDKNDPSSRFKIRLGMSLTGHEALEIAKSFDKMITINEHLAVVEKLWNKFYKAEEDGISLLTACEIFKYFKIFSDNYECKKYILSILGRTQVLSFRNFQQLFAKSMLKGAFFNLSKRLFEGNYAEKEMPPGFKIIAYQRALLMSGVKCPNSNISIEEGQKIINALEKFQKFDDVSYDDLWIKVLKAQGKTEKDGEAISLRLKKNIKVINDIKKISRTYFSRTISKKNTLKGE